MTTIKSIDPGAQNLLSIGDDGEETSVSLYDPRVGWGSIHVATAELAAALGLVTQEDLDRKQAAWENECGNLEMAQRQIDAMSDAVALARDEADGWKARAEKAEATIAAVRAWRDGEEQFDALDAILDPKPPFVLPTEGGAVIEYTDHHGTTQRWFRTRSEQRPWVDREGNTWHDAGLEKDIAGDFTVRIGAYE